MPVILSFWWGITEPGRTRLHGSFGGAGSVRTGFRADMGFAVMKARIANRAAQLQRAAPAWYTVQFSQYGLGIGQLENAA